MRTRTALAGVAAGAAWLSFASDGLPARAAVGAVLVLLPAVTLAGHLRSAGRRSRGPALQPALQPALVRTVLPVVAAAVTALALAGEDLGLPLGAEGGPALVALALALWTALLLRRPAATAGAPLPASLSTQAPFVPVVPAPLTPADVPVSPQPSPLPAAPTATVAPVAQARR